MNKPIVIELLILGLHGKQKPLSIKILISLNAHLISIQPEIGQNEGKQ